MKSLQLTGRNRSQERLFKKAELALDRIGQKITPEMVPESMAAIVEQEAAGLKRSVLYASIIRVKENPEIVTRAVPQSFNYRTDGSSLATEIIQTVQNSLLELAIHKEKKRSWLANRIDCDGKFSLGVMISGMVGGGAGTFYLLSLLAPIMDKFPLLAVPFLLVGAVTVVIGMMAGMIIPMLLLESIEGRANNLPVDRVQLYASFEGPSGENPIAFLPHQPAYAERDLSSRVATRFQLAVKSEIE